MAAGEPVPAHNDDHAWTKKKRKEHKVQVVSSTGLQIAAPTLSQEDLRERHDVGDGQLQTATVSERLSEHSRG